MQRLFSEVTGYLGFTSHTDEYKVMGMAEHGAPPEVSPVLGTLLDID